MPLTPLLFPFLALAVVLWIANGMLPRTDANLESDGRRHQLITPTDHLLSANRNHTLLVPRKMSLCPPVPPVMVGRVPVNNSLIQQDLTAAQIGADHWDSLLGPGGRNRPQSCTSRHKVAIIIPLRDREQHLRQFLRHMHPFLNKQQLDYTIFVVEQTAESKFNRGMLMNIGAVEAVKLSGFGQLDCFIFHDVDLLPEDDRNLYTCPDQPRHMSAAVDIFNYRLPYRTIFGGVCAISVHHFQRINGFANSFWGWGGEDDDLANRVLQHNLTIWRYPLEYARYTMLNHNHKEKRSFKRLSKIRKTKQRWHRDGLSNLKYQRKRLYLDPLYTRILVRISK